MLKKTLKTLWIAALSTLMKVLAQNLTRPGFGELPKLGSIPLEYLAINFIIFVGLTVLFIVIEEYMPTYKLLKGVLFSLLVSVIWIALLFQPLLFSNFKDYVTGIGVFFVPMLIYGAFLGYLSSEKKYKFTISRTQFRYFIISFTWLIFHLIFIIFIPPPKAQLFNYFIWLLGASFIIGFISGFFYEIHLNSKYNTLLVSSIIVVVFLFTFYIDRYASGKPFEWEYFIRFLLDAVSVILALQVIELFSTKKILFKNLDKD